MGIRRISFIWLPLALICVAATCSVKLGDINIPPYADTYYVEQFSNNAPSSPPELGIDFSELFRDKVRRDTRLVYSETNPDLEFEGVIQDFRVTAVAPTAGEQTQFSRLTIRISVDFIDNEDESLNWTQAFSHDLEFPSDQNLLDVQEDLINQIYDQIAQDIFQKAFGKW